MIEVPLSTKRTLPDLLLVPIDTVRVDNRFSYENERIASRPRLVTASALVYVSSLESNACPIVYYIASGLNIIFNRVIV
jgi:hypothetical protein